MEYIGELCTCVLVETVAVKCNIVLQNICICTPSVQPIGAACGGWLPGCGRFPAIGGRPGNTAATTFPLAAAADSRLTSSLSGAVNPPFSEPELLKSR